MHGFPRFSPQLFRSRRCNRGRNSTKPPDSKRPRRAGSTSAILRLQASFAFRPCRPVRRLSRFSHSFCLTFLPGYSRVPFAERVKTCAPRRPGSPVGGSTGASGCSFGSAALVAGVEGEALFRRAVSIPCAGDRVSSGCAWSRHRPRSGRQCASFPPASRPPLLSAFPPDEGRQQRRQMRSRPIPGMPTPSPLTQKLSGTVKEGADPRRDLNFGSPPPLKASVRASVCRFG